ncbi:uncharacterized protein BDW70DRAFT_99979 [Aspergillus foveolatus]|uniref:uncharacterized protein n=1 Tax=Aspergillus foveolatus TaxID=210207 RepID=UPI003CCDE8C8
MKSQNKMQSFYWTQKYSTTVGFGALVWSCCRTSAYLGTIMYAITTIDSWATCMRSLRPKIHKQQLITILQKDNRRNERFLGSI